MTLELWILLGATLLGLVHIGAASFAFKAEVGSRYTAGPRDEDRRPTGLAGRLTRAQTNFFESYPLFVAVALMVHVTGASSLLSAAGAGLYLAGRLVYLPLYAAGVPWLRSFAWCAATLGIVVAGAPLLAG